MNPRTPLILGIAATVVALALLVAEAAGNDWFLLHFGSQCAFPLWILVGIYAALQFTVWTTQRRAAASAPELTEDDVARWGEALERVTPVIVTMYGSHTPLREIADSLQTSHGIPPDVTIRYIITLARLMRARESSR